MSNAAARWLASTIVRYHVCTMYRQSNYTSIRMFYICIIYTCDADAYSPSRHTSLARIASAISAVGFCLYRRRRLQLFAFWQPVQVVGIVIRSRTRYPVVVFRISYRTNVKHQFTQLLGTLTAVQFFFWNITTK